MSIKHMSGRFSTWACDLHNLRFLSLMMVLDKGANLKNSKESFGYSHAVILHQWPYLSRTVIIGAHRFATGNSDDCLSPPVTFIACLSQHCKNLSRVWNLQACKSLSLIFTQKLLHRYYCIEWNLLSMGHRTNNETKITNMSYYNYCVILSFYILIICDQNVWIWFFKKFVFAH